jgi:hypothetical protein
MNSFKEGDGRRAWKSPPWAILDSLHEKGYISDPANKNKSVWLTDEGAKLSEELFEKFFGATWRHWRDGTWRTGDRRDPVPTFPATLQLFIQTLRGHHNLVTRITGQRVVPHIHHLLPHLK